MTQYHMHAREAKRLKQAAASLDDVTLAALFAAQSLKALVDSLAAVVPKVNQLFRSPYRG